MGLGEGVSGETQADRLPSASVRATPSAPRASVTYPNIDGLRALAALAVVLCHTAISSSLSGSLAGSYLVQLRAGVEVFFVISGFVLYRPFAEAHLAGGRGPGLGGYFRRRLLRILPAYWVVLTVAILWLHVVLVSGPANTVENYSLVQTYFPIYFTGLGPAWTLVVEITFYAVLPLYASVLWWLGSRGRAYAEFVGVVVLGLAGVGFALWSAFGDPPTFVNVLPANLAPFAVGIGLAVAHAWTRRQAHPPQWSRWLGARPWAFWAVAVVAWSSIVWMLHYPSELSFGRLPGHTAFEYSLILVVVGFCVVVPMVFGPQDRGRLRQGLQLRPIVFIGTISYAIYLWHVPVLYETTKVAQRLHLTPAVPHFNFFVITGITLVITIAVAVVSWYLIERPAIHLSRLKSGDYRSWWAAYIRRRPSEVVATAQLGADGPTTEPAPVDFSRQRTAIPSARTLLE